MITNDVIMTSLPKQCQNSDFHETVQIIYHSSGFDKSYPKMYIILNLSLCVKSYGHLYQILALFTMLIHQIWSCHVTHVGNFENFKNRPDSTFNFKKSHKVSRGKFSTANVMRQKPHWGRGGGGIQKI